MFLERKGYRKPANITTTILNNRRRSIIAKARDEQDIANANQIRQQFTIDDCTPPAKEVQEIIDKLQRLLQETHDKPVTHLDVEDDDIVLDVMHGTKD